jgi:hypothetical protein
MGVDHVDLWQLQSLADPIEWDTALSPGGALEAAVEAGEQGLIRWIGVTGHGSQIAANHAGKESMVSSAKNDSSDVQDRMLGSVPGAPALGRGPATDGGFTAGSIHCDQRGPQDSRRKPVLPG